MKLNVKAFSLTCGIFWGGSIFLMTLINLLTRNIESMQIFGGWAGRFLAIVSSIYPGYEATPVGLAIGLGYGFVDGFIAGLLLSLIYNFLASRLSTTIKM